jgi:hypothetical protein
MRAALIMLALATLALPGCIARTAASIVTAPVRVASAGIDAATTSQAEADQRRGREIRRREERFGQLQRDYERAIARCRGGERAACDKVRAIRAEQQALLPRVPIEPED